MKKQLFLAVAAMLTATTLVGQQNVPDAYGSYGQAVVFDSTYIFVENSGLSHIQQHRMVDISTPKGAMANRVVKVDYDPLSAECNIDRVVVHRASGSTDTLVWPEREGNRTVYDYVAPARMIYWGASQKMVEVGHLERGDQLEYWTSKQGFTYALLTDVEGGLNANFASAIDRLGDDRFVPPMRGHFYDIVPFWSEIPTSNKVYQVCIEDEKNLQYHIYNGELEVSTEAQPNHYTLYTFRAARIVPLQREARAVAGNDMGCKLLLSTAPDWQSKSRWFYGVNEAYGSFLSTPEMQQKVNELLADAKSELDSISRLTHWVADNMRYAGISMGEGEGFTLHNAQMNFTDRCGVCKDKASLLIAMLRAAGFEAYAAMTMAGERIDRIPADQFNHSVCAVRMRDGSFRMLDPTWVPNVRELWSSAEQQQGYLIGTAEGCDLMETPISAPENHYISIKGNTAIDAEGTLSGTLSISAEGQSDAAVRGVFSARQSEWQANLERELLALAPNAEITNIAYTDPDRYLDQPVSITYTFRIPHYATVSKNTLAFIPLSARGFYRRAMGHLFFNTTPESRTQGFTDRCSRLVDISEVVALPDTYSQFHYPQYVDGIADPVAAFGCGFQMEGNQLRFGETVMFSRRVYQAQDWPVFRAAIISQQTVATTPAVLTK